MATQKSILSWDSNEFALSAIEFLATTNLKSSHKNYKDFLFH